MRHTNAWVPHSLLAAESEDTTDIDRLPAQVPAVQTNSHRPVAQLAKRQGHGTEIQEAATEIRHTQTQIRSFNGCIYSLDSNMDIVTSNGE